MQRRVSNATKKGELTWFENILPSISFALILSNFTTFFAFIEFIVVIRKTFVRLNWLEDCALQLQNGFLWRTGLKRRANMRAHWNNDETVIILYGIDFGVQWMRINLWKERKIYGYAMKGYTVIFICYLHAHALAHTAEHFFLPWTLKTKNSFNEPLSEHP